MKWDGLKIVLLVRLYNDGWATDLYPLRAAWRFAEWHRNGNFADKHAKREAMVVDPETGEVLF